jgi:hypothetical protein
MRNARWQWHCSHLVGKTPAQIRAYWIWHHCYWRRVRKAQRAVTFHHTEFRRERERQFLNYFYPKLMYLLQTQLRAPDLPDLIKSAGVLCLGSAGYRKRAITMDGRPTKSAIKKVNELLDLPRMQAGLIMRMAEQGLTPEHADARFRSLVDSTNEDIALRALIQYYKITIPVVTKTQNQHLHMNAENVFKQEIFERPPEMILEGDTTPDE